MVRSWLRRRRSAWRSTLIDFSDKLRGHFGRIRALVPAIRQIVPGEQPSGRKHAVYVHFDRSGMVHDYVMKAISELVDNGFAINLVSNSPKLERSQIDLVLPLVREVVHRRNVGYDFAAYRDGIARLPAPEAIDRLILSNDSVYGPVYPLADTIAAAEAMDVDAFGITDSWEIRYHLQSYFLIFFPNAIRSKAFRRFWSRFPTISDKPWLIRNGEVRLTSVLARSKLRLGALCPYWDVSRKILAQLDEMDLGGRSPLMTSERMYLRHVKGMIIAGQPINPSHYFWESLIVDWNCPFLKRELLQFNPVGVPRPWEWEAVLRAHTSYDTNLVLGHLKSL